jgi:hypothetical protein
MKPITFATLLILATGLLAGCGGNASTALPDSERGEGNIPIGSVPDPEQEVEIDPPGEEGSTTLGVSSDGTVELPEGLDGEYEIIIDADDDNLVTQSFTVVFDGGSEYLFVAGSIPVAQYGNVTGVSLQLPTPPHVNVGDTVTIQTTVNGSPVDQISPTLWTTGQVGFFEDRYTFRATQAGTGTIEAGVGDHRATVPIIVYE